MKNKLIFGAVLLLLSGCATISLTDDGKKVRVLEPGEVDSCRELGKTNTSVTSTIIVERPIEAITKELRIIGRNAAARMGGDTIVPLTVIDQGQQTFVVYKCVNPDG
ncbi:MAG: DUF4156 domain-containing protein [Pseudomonadota bacterium]